MPTQDRRIGGGWVEFGSADLYPGQTLTWALVGHPELVPGQVLATMAGFVIVPPAPPPPGPREVDGGLL
jgi:hypothetical protein